MFEVPRFSRRSAVAALAVAGIGTACRASSVGTAPQPSLDDVADRYVRLTLQLAQHQPSLVESWLGPTDWRPGPRMPVSAIRSEIEEARTASANLAALDEPAERLRCRPFSASA
jgi:hypothetical protein